MSTKTKLRPDIEIGQLVDRFMRSIHFDLGRKAPAFDREKVGPLGGMVLMTLADLQPVPMHELVRTMSRDKAQITRLLQSLGQKGLVEKLPSSTDKRVCVLRLSAKGQQTVDGLRQALAETIDEVLLPLNADERRLLKDLLRKAFTG
ncbi:MAG: MarR family transcriptional regulator [Pseudomonadota bacterium]